MTNSDQLDKIESGHGFFAALDQSGGSTPRLLAAYGIPESAYANNEEMFDLVHQMRSRIMMSPSFDGDRILGTILFQDTLDRQVDGQRTAAYLWNVKGIVPFLKVDEGLEPETDGVQRMKPIRDLESVLDRAWSQNVFGTKMRSFIKMPDAAGVKDVVHQQFEFARPILASGLVPILEPEIDIHSPGKAEAESILKEEILEGLAGLPEGQQVMLKLTLPDKDDFYRDFSDDRRVLRVLALSGGYNRSQAVQRLARDHGMIASFARALMEGLSNQQSDQEFDAVLDDSVSDIFQASVT
jgi:fructose-bisphosphate aldolase class I